MLQWIVNVPVKIISLTQLILSIMQHLNKVHQESSNASVFSNVHET